MIYRFQINPTHPYKFEDCLIQQQLMIKGRKIQPQNVNLVIPVKKNIKNMEAARISEQSGSQYRPLQAELQKEMKEVCIDDRSESQNYLNMLNKEKDIKQNRKQSQKIVDNRSNLGQKSKKMTEQTRKTQPQPLRKDNIKQAQTINDKKTTKIAKPESRDTRSTKQRIQQVLKQQEIIRKALKRTSSQTTQRVQQIAVRDKVDQLKNNKTELTQQNLPQQQQDDLQEMQRQILPSPIQDQLSQQQQMNFDQDGLNMFIEYQQDSSFEEAFSFLPPASPQTSDPTPNLPINMDLFELTADQLLALDYFQV